MEAQPPTAGRSRLPGSGPNTVELPRQQASCTPPPSTQLEQAASWRPVQCSNSPRHQASCHGSCALPPSSRPEPAAGWRPVQFRGRPRQQASCAPPPRRRPGAAAGGHTYNIIVHIVPMILLNLVGHNIICTTYNIIGLT